MGQVFSFVGSKVSRSIKRFNVENRAQRVIARDKPLPAPKYEATMKEIEILMKDHPHELEEMKKKDPLLDSYLKKIYVVSHDPEPQVTNKNENLSGTKKLPTDRTFHSGPELDFIEPDFVPNGKITLKQALKFLAQNHSDSEMYNKYFVSDNYKISLEDAENILKHFATFNVYVPEQQPEANTKKKLQKLLTRKDESDNQQKLS